MTEIDIQVFRVSSLEELEETVDKVNIFKYDDVQNEFNVLTIGKEKKIGITYYNYGIDPEIVCDKDNKVIYVGFGKNLMVINTSDGKVLSDDNLQSIFYEFLTDSKGERIYIICELDVYCYNLNAVLWNIGFKDIINDYSIVDDKRIYISCDDGTDIYLSLDNGSVLE
ncbi:hypothetical protein [Anaerosacchariphilus polymeriproducens]|uniref:Uncharacterized protein n=1 Tax=Anaerosacchariphilus polymeriproducens TaxID=1812858 RepID=A0A371AYK7_9FIRM|nr:hypothetical protein [Anaerosacchariphilus polymeriproducens]RDU24560.1 hypothetical protein DWV06_03600 [Anaerosacchariphilus polymeriproducens]